MNLPHNTQQPESQVIVYNLSSPPIFFNNIPATPQVSQMMPMIIASVANNLAQYAGTNPFRMFAFNFYAKSNWNNRDFFDLVAFVTGYIELDINTGAVRDTNAIINTSIPDAISLYIVQLLAVFQNLRSVVDNHTLNALHQNAGFFQSKLSMILSFYQRSGINSPLLSQGMQARSPQIAGNNFDPYRSQQQQYTQQRMGTNVDQQFRNGAISGGQVFSNSSVSNAGTLRQDRFFSDRNFNIKSDFQQKVVSPPPASEVFLPELTMEESTAEAWRPSAKQPYRSMINRNFFDKRYYFEDGIVVEVIEEKGFDEVDRSKHSTALLGRSYELNTTVRKDIVAEQIDNLKNPPVVPKRKDDSIPDVPDIEFHEADRKPICENFLDIAILQGRKKQRMVQKEGGSASVFQCFTAIAHPFITRTNYRDIISKLQSCIQFKDMARFLKEMGDGLSKQQKESIDDTFDFKDEVEKEKDRQDLVLFLNSVDDFLTKLVNNWVDQKLGLTNVSIDSFTEDVATLPAYLEKNYGTTYSEAFNIFQQRTIEHSFMQLDEETEAILTEKLNDDDANLTYSYFVETVSLSYIDLTADELDICLNGRECLLIPELAFPELHAIAVNATTVTNFKPFMPMRFLMITQDNEIFELHRSTIGQPTVLINRY